MWGEHEGMCGVVEGMKPASGMVVVQVVFAGVNVFYKLAINDGMDLRVLVAFRYLFATAFLAPLAFFFERKSRPKLTWRVLVLSFLCGLFGGTLAQNLYITSLKLTSATFASAMTNLIPAITFTLAVLFRLESLALRTLSGQAKVLGTLVGVGGAMLLTFYKGVAINLWSTHLNLVKSHHGGASNQEAGNRGMGSLLAVASCFSYALWLIIQAKMSKEYPCHYSSTALMCIMATIQAVVFAIVVERDWAQWRMGFDIRLLSAAYSGIVASGLILTVLAWCIKRKGPLYASIFNPLMLVIVALLSSLLLNEKLHLGSVLGAVLIVVGLYMVLWGKGREAAKVGELPQEEATVQVVIDSPNINAVAQHQQDEKV
ncbi:WAT1-related protein At1g25270-like [Ananas comosus]|uniref:WAT1-related protein n=1 Tax=Ananas comosus TaxID=4615 RepID=A0A6P5EU79_ANACO|nr:WAT1-related protein At1g25270-like [Ananas comosus]